MLLDNHGKQAICRSNLIGCELCDFRSSSQYCGQCRGDMFLRNGKCVGVCGPRDKISTSNKICLETHGIYVNNYKFIDCRVDNCGDCILNNPSVCKTCLNGYFMFNNKCLQTCPENWRADRINWICLREPVFAWYWIFPSRTSCHQRCGQPLSIHIDCS